MFTRNVLNCSYERRSRAALKKSLPSTCAVLEEGGAAGREGGEGARRGIICSPHAGVLGGPIEPPRCVMLARGGAEEKELGR